MHIIWGALPHTFTKSRPAGENLSTQFGSPTKAVNSTLVIRPLQDYMIERIAWNLTLVHTKAKKTSRICLVK